MRGSTGTDAGPLLDRRTVVTGAAVAAAACAAAGCGAGSATGGTAPTADAAAVTTTAVGNGSAGTKLGPVADVPVGGGVVYQDLEVVVTQPEAGRYEGLSAVCTHTGCIVDKVANSLIECPCHGSRYHLDGTVARGPAPRALAPRPVTVVAGTIVLS
jgi:Rieske Fe-S protein